MRCETCVEGNDPRTKGHCVRCARPLPRSVPRAITEERADTWHAAKTQGVDASAIIEFSELRAAESGIRNFATRDFALEILEELGDARNYATWMLRQLRDRATAGEEVGAQVEVASRVLAGTAALFEELRRVRE